jgi:nicotinate phosphoribosyltransferase
MSLATLGVDAYQLTTLLAHADSGRLEQQVAMGFFFRKLPRHRNYVVFCGLRGLLEHAAQLGLTAAELATLDNHAILGPALAARPAVRRALASLDGFVGEIDAPPEGTLAFAGPGVRTDGQPLLAAGTPIALYTPLVQVRTDLLRAKLIETPWLGRLNHGSMVASKAARVVDAAAGKPVLEFGARRTHPAAAVDASYAAYLAGAAGTSNMAAQHHYGIPALGTMDHFFLQSAERSGVPVEVTEREAFATFMRAFPEQSTLLVDTYDTERGIRNAVAATDGQLSGIRLDCSVTVDSVRRARQILDELGARQARIFVSDALDELRVRELSEVADGFGVGENITCVPDAAVGVGAVAKIVQNGYGKLTMKIARGSGKATLPGSLQVYRFADHDLVALADEPAPSGGRALLEPVWRGRAPVGELPSLAASRAWVRRQIETLPPPLRALEPAARPWPLVASDGLAARIDALVKEAGL